MFVEVDAEVFAAGEDGGAIDFGREVEVFDFLLDRFGPHLAIRDGVHLSIGVEDAAQFIRRK